MHYHRRAAGFAAPWQAVQVPLDQVQRRVDTPQQLRRVRLRTHAVHARYHVGRAPARAR